MFLVSSLGQLAYSSVAEGRASLPFWKRVGSQVGWTELRRGTLVGGGTLRFFG